MGITKNMFRMKKVYVYPILKFFLSVLFSSQLLTYVSGQLQSTGKVPGEPGSGWLVRQGTEEMNLWTLGKATINPMDSTRFIITDGNELVNSGKGIDIYTEQEYRDVHIELEFMIPVKGNSGIYVMGEYEVQIYDSYWLRKNNQPVLANQWMGTIVATHEPDLHPEKGGGEWQQVSIDFIAPRFDESGNKITLALFKEVRLNGIVIHENIEVRAPTPVNLTGKESREGPLMFQGFAGPVAYRNIIISPL
jgi:hypothetical protein